MGEVKNVLWPNDLSKCSEGASPHVVSLAKKFNAVVHVLYIAQDMAHHEPWYGDFDRSHADQLIEWERKKARERQNEICRKHLKDCAEYHTHIDIGDPARKIIDFIDGHNIDLVVMCRKGESGEFNMGGLLKESLNIPRYRLSSLQAHKRNKWPFARFFKTFSKDSADYYN